MDSQTKGQILQTSRPQVYKKETRDGQEIPRTRLGVSDSKHPLDGPEWTERLRKLMQWRRQARVYQADNRMEQAIDEDFYDSIQYEPEDLHVLEERRQPPLVYNVSKNVLNWIFGVELKTRMDHRILPRKKNDSANAKTKTKLFKYVADVSKAAFHRSQAFQECIKSGLGWIETGVRKNGDEPIFIRSERWRNMWFDHLGLELDCSDWRYIVREKWVDLDIIQAMFPERKDALKVISEGVNSLYPYLPDDTVITDYASEFDLESDLDSLFGGPFDGARERVKAVEMWYRMPDHVKLLHVRDEDTPFGALDGSIYRPQNADHKYLVDGGYFSTIDAYMLTVRCAMWAGATYLQDILSPYHHNRFPFIPLWCYRRKRDNLPYGVMRDIRDPQSDLNKRRSRSLFLLSANQVIHEKGAFDDPNKFRDEMNRADGDMEVNEGVLVGKKLEIVKHNVDAEAHVKMAQDDERFIQRIAGVEDPNLGKTEKELSGKALAQLSIQGQTTSGIFFDNTYYAFQHEGEIVLSLIEQFCDQKKEFLISGDQSRDEFITINELTDQGIQNNITLSKARFIVSKQDYRESQRLSMLDMLSQLVQSLAKSMPQVALALLDEVIDFMDDLPNKDEMVSRIRKINKQHAPEDEMTPEEKEQFKQAQAQVQQEQNAIKQIQLAMSKAELAIKQGEAADKENKAMRNHVDAQMKKLEGFIKALEAAQIIRAAPQLVGAADRLIIEAEQAGEKKPGNGGAQRRLLQPSGGTGLPS